jgi:diguanylate cyclase (GGDEF)-like protein
VEAPVPPDDAARVAALQRLGVLDQPVAADFVALTRLAVFVTGAPVSALNFIDATRQFQAATTGMDPTETPRRESMCAHTIAANAPIVVADASRDPRFADSAFVDGRLGEARMYASIPLHDPDGYAVGSLCVVDPIVRSLSPEQQAALEDIAAQAERLLELRRQYLVLLDVLAQVDHDARHDTLTGLANRRVLLDRLELALSRAVRTGRPPTLFFCDLDRFKAVNDIHGHEAGDAALVGIATALRGAMRPHDTVARLGGDEFVVLCEDLHARDAHVVSDRLRGITEPRHRLQVSVGMHVCALDDTAATALAHADTAMYEQKRRRRAARDVIPEQECPRQESNLWPTA